MMLFANGEHTLSYESAVRLGFVKGFLYFVRSSVGSVKIGFSTNVYARFVSMKSGCPVLLELIGWVPAYVREEGEWHERFKSLQAIGEWFIETPELTAAITKALSHRSANRYNGITTRMPAHDRWYKEQERRAARDNGKRPKVSA